MADAHAPRVDEPSLFVLDERGNPVSLTIARDGFKVKNSGKVKGSSSKKTIPYYNITNVEVAWGAQDTPKLKLEHVVPKSNYKIEEESWVLSDVKDKAALDEMMRVVHNLAYPEGVKFGKRAYVLVNPNSGPGNGVRKWEQEARPMFDSARMTYEATILKKGGEATTLVQGLDLEAYDTIVSVSGDGTPHEIFNGLGKRADARRALRQLPVSHIPAGSGNALALNLYGSNKAGAAALAIIKGYVTTIDLVSVTQGDERYLSFLSQAVGIIAESDLGTENLRWMGARRFEVGLVMRVFQKKCYPCDLAIKVVHDSKERIKGHYRQYMQSTSQDTPESNGGLQEGDDCLPSLKYGTIKDELPEDWELVPYDNIGNFYCGNMGFMAPDANFFPGALPADGCMDLVRINGDMPVLKSTKTLLSVESGKFFDMPQVQYQKIAAYRIIPRDQEDGYISIDGEKVPFEQFQAEVHQGLGRVLSKEPGKLQCEGPMGWDASSKDKDKAVSKPAEPPAAEDVTV